jgi:hypothetical protein
MRTTVRLDDALLEQAKRFAAERHQTLTELFESALREKLARGATSPKRRRTIPLPTFSGRGVRAGIDLHDHAALLDAMDEID